MGVVGSMVVLGVVEGGCGCYGVQGGTKSSRGGLWVLWDPRWY